MFLVGVEILKIINLIIILLQLAVTSDKLRVVVWEEANDKHKLVCDGRFKKYGKDLNNWNNKDRKWKYCDVCPIRLIRRKYRRTCPPENIEY